MPPRVDAAILQPGSVLLGRHHHEGQDSWTLPGGGIEPGEPSEAAVGREVRAGTGRQTSGLRLLFEGGGEQGVLVACPEEQTPVLGHEPELGPSEQMLTEGAWFP